MARRAAARQRRVRSSFSAGSKPPSRTIPSKWLLVARHGRCDSPAALFLTSFMPRVSRGRACCCPLNTYPAPLGVWPVREAVRECAKQPACLGLNAERTVHRTGPALFMLWSDAPGLSAHTLVVRSVGQEDGSPQQWGVVHEQKANTNQLTPIVVIYRV